MRKKWISLLLLFSVIFLVGCSQNKNEEKTSVKQQTDKDSALMYTFTIDEHDYRFRMLDGWLKYPNKDDKIVFLVGNKEIKSFMTAGFESEDMSLDEYKDRFMNKVSESADSVISQPVKKELNGLDSYYVSFTMKDAKERLLTYKTYLIETDGYFVNLAAWTSEKNPGKETQEQLDLMLETFEQLK